MSKWVAERVVRQDVRWVVFKGAGGHTHALPLVGVQILQDAPDISGCFGNPPGTPAGKTARARSPDSFPGISPCSRSFEKLLEMMRLLIGVRIHQDALCVTARARTPEFISWNFPTF